jgi:hypothetical protein
MQTVHRQSHQRNGLDKHHAHDQDLRGLVGTFLAQTCAQLQGYVRVDVRFKLKLQELPRPLVAHTGAAELLYFKRLRLCVGCMLGAFQGVLSSSCGVGGGSRSDLHSALETRTSSHNAVGARSLAPLGCVYLCRPLHKHKSNTAAVCSNLKLSQSQPSAIAATYLPDTHFKFPKVRSGLYHVVK